MADTTNQGNHGTATRNTRKTRVGLVVSDKMQKTVVVAIERRVPHPVYSKMVTRTRRVKAHDEENTAKVGDMVEVLVAVAVCVGVSVAVSTPGRTQPGSGPTRSA